MLTRNIRTSGVCLVFLIVIGIRFSPAEIPGHTRTNAVSNSEATATSTPNSIPQTALIEEGNKIWKLNTQSLSMELYLDLNLPSAFELGDMYITQDGKYIFAIVGTKFDPKTSKPVQEPQEGQVIQINLSDKTQTVIWENSRLARMSPPSPNGTKFVLSLIGEKSNNPAGSYCLFSTQTKNCTQIDGPLDNTTEDFFWIDDNTFAAFIPYSVYVYSVDQSSFAKRSIPLGDHHVTAIAPLPGTSSLIAAAYSTPVFIKVDLTTSEISRFNYGLASDYDTAIWRIGVSPNGQYLWYMRANRMDIVDFNTGKPVLQLDDVSSILWGRDDKTLLVDTYPENASGKIVLLNPSTGMIDNTSDISGEIVLIGTS